METHLRKPELHFHSFTPDIITQKRNQLLQSKLAIISNEKVISPSDPLGYLIGITSIDNEAIVAAQMGLLKPPYSGEGELNGELRIESKTLLSWPDIRRVFIDQEAIKFLNLYDESRPYVKIFEQALRDPDFRVQTTE